MKQNRIVWILLVVLVGLASTDCLVRGRRGRYYGPRVRPARLVIRPWVAAALVSAAIVGTAAAVAAANASYYQPGVCARRTWHGGRWVYYCGNHWAYHEGGVWYAYPPSPPPPADAPPPQLPPEAMQAPTPPPPPGVE